MLVGSVGRLASFNYESRREWIVGFRHEYVLASVMGTTGHLHSYGVEVSTLDFIYCTSGEPEHFDAGSQAGPGKTEYTNDSGITCRHSSMGDFQSSSKYTTNYAARYTQN